MENTQPSLPSPNFVQTRTGTAPHMLTLEFLGYDSPESFDKAAGTPGLCLDYALRWFIHRDTINEFDEKFSPWLEKTFGIPRDIDQKRTEARRKASPNPNRVTPLKEKFQTYLNRVIAKISAADFERLKAEALRLSRTIQIDVAPATRVPAVEPAYFRRADSILAQPLDTINEKVSKYLSLVPDFQLARDEHEKPILESLARLMQNFDAARWAMED